MTSSYNVGVRHILPIYPCWMALVASITQYLKISKIFSFAIILLLLWLGVTCVRQSPDYLAYFNEFAGGSKNGYKHLIDSNLDWGQDLPLLAKYLSEKGNPEIWLQYFGTGSPSSYGIYFQPIVNPYGQPQATDVLLPPLSGGFYIISITHLFGGYILDNPYQYPTDPDQWVALHRKVSLYHKVLLERKSQRLYESIYGSPPTKEELIRLRGFQGLALLKHLKQRDPGDRIGYTMFVYQLTDEELTNLTSP